MQAEWLDFFQRSRRAFFGDTADAAVDAAALLAAGAALLAAAAALVAAAAALEVDSLDVLLPPQAASAREATPSTAADLRTVVRFICLLTKRQATADTVAVATPYATTCYVRVTHCYIVGSS